MRKHKGPATEPWETPALMNFQLADKTFKAALLCLLWRNDSIRPRRSLVIPWFFDLYRRPLSQTLSNAFDKSNKTIRTSTDG